MAKVYVGINHGAGPDGVTAATSSTGAALEVVLDGAKVLSRDQAYELIGQIQSFVATPRAWPMAS